MSSFYSDYREAAEELFPRDWDRAAEYEKRYTEGQIRQICSWIVASGKDRYLAVWDDFSLAPDPNSDQGLDYSQLAGDVYLEKYGERLSG